MPFVHGWTPRLHAGRAFRLLGDRLATRGGYIWLQYTDTGEEREVLATQGFHFSYDEPSNWNQDPVINTEE